MKYKCSTSRFVNAKLISNQHFPLKPVEKQMHQAFMPELTRCWCDIGWKLITIYPSASTGAHFTGSCRGVSTPGILGDSHKTNGGASFFGKEENKLYGRMKSVKPNSVCDRDHQSPWSIVGWHAALTFSYIICHHFTINCRFTTSLNVGALKHPLVSFFSLSSCPPSSPPRDFAHRTRPPVLPTGAPANAGEGQSR